MNKLGCAPTGHKAWQIKCGPTCDDMLDSISIIFEKSMRWRRSDAGKNVFEMIADALPDG